MSNDAVYWRTKAYHLKFRGSTLRCDQSYYLPEWSQHWCSTVRFDRQCQIILLVEHPTSASGKFEYLSGPTYYHNESYDSLYWRMNKHDHCLCKQMFSSENNDLETYTFLLWQYWKGSTLNSELQNVQTNTDKLGIPKHKTSEGTSEPSFILSPGSGMDWKSLSCEFHFAKCFQDIVETLWFQNQ